MKVVYIVNASPILRDTEVSALVKPMQKHFDRDFLPIWRDRMVDPDIQVAFARMRDIPTLPADCWPIFLNRHSTDANALGWHDDDGSQNIRTFSRCFVGDCLLMGLNWQVTVFHEADEMVVDPDIRRVYKMPDGRFAAFETNDAVEADEQGYDIDGVTASNFVMPDYFSRVGKGPFDFRKKLHGRCPTLTPGGYMSVTDANGNWTQIAMNRNKGLLGRRAALMGFRRQARQELGIDGLQVEPED